MNVNDKFSIRRLWLVTRLHASSVWRQLADYAVISFVAGVLFMVQSTSGHGIFTLVIMGLLFYIALAFGPLVFASRKGLLMQTALPATGWEKTAFYFIYVFLVMPAALLLPFALCMDVGISMAGGDATDLLLFVDILTTYAHVNPVYCVLAPAVPMAVCLLGATAFRQRRAAYSFLVVLGAILCLLVLSAVGLGITLEGLYEMKVIGHSVYSVNSNAQLFADLAHTIATYPGLIGGRSTFGMCENTALAVIFAGLLWAIYRTIKNRQI